MTTSSPSTAVACSNLSISGSSRQVSHAVAACWIVKAVMLGRLVHMDRQMTVKETSL